MSDQCYTPTAQEFVEAWIQAHQVPVGSGGWVDRGSAPRERIAEAHRGIAEIRREAAASALREAHADLVAYTDSGAPFGGGRVEDFLLQRADRIEKDDE